MKQISLYGHENLPIEIAVYNDEFEYTAIAYSTIDGKILSRKSGNTENQAIGFIEEDLVMRLHINLR